MKVKKYVCVGGIKFNPKPKPKPYLFLNWANSNLGIRSDEF